MRRRDFIRHVPAAAAACIASPALAQGGGNRIVLGQSAALTGASGQVGKEFQRGAKLFFDRLNEKGGVNGRRIELTTLDDGYEPDRCKANAEKLIADGVLALFGFFGTPTSLAALPLATAARVPFFAPFSGAQNLREPFNRQVFHVRASYFDETARIVNQLARLGVRKVAVFHQNDSYGEAGLAGVTRALAAHQAKPVVTATVERNSAEVAGAVKTILAAEPEAVVQISASQSCAAFIVAARKAGYVGQFYNVSFVGAQALARELGRDARGVVVSQVMPYPFTPLTPLTGEFLQAVAASPFDIEANYTTIEGYVDAKVIVEGLRRAGAQPTRDGLIAGLESLHDFDLGGFFVDFNAKKHTGSTFVDLTILTEDGKVRR